MKRRHGARPEPPEWLRRYEAADWLKAEDLEDPPRYQAGALMPLDEVAYRRFMAEAREWLTVHGYDLAEGLQIIRAARRRAQGMPP